MPLMRAIEGVNSVTLGWPMQEERLPCVSISERENATRRMYDDMPYGAEVIYDVRVFALAPEAVQAIACRVDELMCTEGYIRILCYEDLYDGVRVKLLRYTKLA